MKNWQEPLYVLIWNFTAYLVMLCSWHFVFTRSNKFDPDLSSTTHFVVITLINESNCTTTYFSNFMQEFIYIDYVDI